MNITVTFDSLTEVKEFAAMFSRQATGYHSTGYSTTGCSTDCTGGARSTNPGRRSGSCCGSCTAACSADGSGTAGGTSSFTGSNCAGHAGRPDQHTYLHSGRTGEGCHAADGFRKTE